MRVLIVAFRGVRTSVLGSTAQIRQPAQHTSYLGEPSAQDSCCKALFVDGGYGSSAGKSKEEKVKKKKKVKKEMEEESRERNQDPGSQVEKMVRFTESGNAWE